MVPLFFRRRKSCFQFLRIFFLLILLRFGLLALVDSPTALSWNGFKENDEVIIGTYALMTAKNTKDVLEALKKYGSAGEGIVFATVFGGYS